MIRIIPFLTAALVAGTLWLLILDRDRLDRWTGRDTVPAPAAETAAPAATVAAEQGAAFPVFTRHGGSDPTGPSPVPQKEFPVATFSYRAFVIEHDNLGDSVALTSAVLSISTPWPLVDLSYNDWSPAPDDSTVTGLFRATVRVDGALLPYDPLMGFNMSLTQITWGSGSGIFMAFDYTATPGAMPTPEMTVVVQVDGDAIPVTDLASLLAFEESATFGRVTSGDWAPGDPYAYDPNFLLGALQGLTGYSEDDDYVNTLPDTGNSQRFRMRDGDDRFTGNAMREEVYGGQGNDTLSGNDGNDTIYGEVGDDSLSGGNGYDTLYGGDGNDALDGGAFYDLLEGGIGKDTLSGGDGSDELYGDDGVDSLLGGRGSDVLWGQAGNDVLLGEQGNDWLHGGDGNDRLEGGRGNDQLTGGIGADRFTFRPPMGRDAITDFSAAEGDVLFFAAALTGGVKTLTDAQVLASYATDLGDAIRFDFGGGQTVTLFAVSTLAELDGHITLF